MFSAVESFPIDTWEKDFLELTNKVSRVVSLQPILPNSFPALPGIGERAIVTQSWKSWQLASRPINEKCFLGTWIGSPKSLGEGRLTLEWLQHHCC